MPTLKKALLALAVSVSVHGATATAAPVETATSRPASVVAEATRPNVIVIYVDDMGWGDVGYHGFKDIKTPNMDKLAEEGTWFSQAYVSASICGPSRAGMITGAHQQRFGIYGNFDENHIPQSQPLAMEMMKDIGYKTAVIGKWHLGELTGLPNERGADFFYGFLDGSHDYFKSTTNPDARMRFAPIYRNTEMEPPIQEKGGYLTELFTDEAINFINEAAEEEEPFFLYLAHFAVHHPWQVPDSYVERLKDLPVEEGITGQERKHFAGMALALDDGIGEVMDSLKEHGIDDNTLVFFMSDNGTPRGQGFAQPTQKQRGETTMSSPGPFNGFKGDTYEGGIRVPAAVRWPGKIPAGQEYRQMVSAMDIVPTIVAATGAQTWDGAVPFDGKNLMPYLNGEMGEEGPHKTMYWRRDDDYAIRDGDWKLTWNSQSGPQTIRLFNIENDPGEWNDVVNEHPELAQELQNKFDAWEATLPVNKLSYKPQNRNMGYPAGEIIDVKEYNRAATER